MKTSWIAIIILVGIIACPASAKLIVPNSTELTVSSEYTAKINAVNYNNGTSSRWICNQDQCWFNWSNPYSRNITGIYFIDSDTVHTIYGVDATRPNLSQPLFPTTSFAPVNTWKWINFSNNYTTSAISIKFTSSPTWSTFAEIQYYEDEPPSMNTTIRLYLPMNGTTGTTTLPDISSFQEALTRYGDAQIYSEASSWKFYNATYFDGTGDMLRYPPEAINFGTSYPWSIGFWMKSNSSTSWNSIVGNIDRTTRSPGELRIGSRTNAGNVFYIDGWWAGADALASNSSENLNDGNPHYVLVKRVNATAIEGWVDGHRSVTDIVNSSMPAGDPVRNLTIGFNGVDNIYYKGYIDDLFITYGNISGSTVPTTEFLSWEMGASGTAPVASFTATPNPSFVNNEAQFNDTSTGTPTTWGWTFGDGNYTGNTTQNPTHLYTSIGTYSVCLNATNSYGTNTTCSNQVVTNVSAFHPQDVWMEGQYNRTFHITSSSDGTPLAATYITSDGQTGTASTLGYAYVTEGFGVYTITVSMEGYATKTVSFIVDEDGTTEIQLTPTESTSSSKLNVLYPHEVRITCVDEKGTRLQGVLVAGIMVNSTVDNTNWFSTLFSISETATPINGTEIGGITDTGGAVVMPMIGSGYYRLIFNSTTYGINQKEYFLQPQYNDYVYTFETLTDVSAANPDDYINITLGATDSGAATIYLNASYNDSSSTTSNVTFFVNYPNRTLLYSKSYPSVSGSNQSVVVSYAVTNTAGASYVYGMSGNSTLFGVRNESQGISLKGTTGIMYNPFVYKGSW